MNKFAKRAFTLAEVLMVVGILGVVSLLTVPNLKNNTMAETDITSLKTTYNQLETAVAAVLGEYGSIQSAKTAGSSSECNSNDETICFNNLVTNKLDTRLNCQNSNLSKCYSADKLTDIDGETINAQSNSRCGYAFIISNGASVCYLSSTGNYEIDINGPKKGPNVRGIDVFSTYFDENDDLSYDDPGTALTSRKGGDDFVKNRDETAWAMTFGNIDYIKCKASLKWHNVTQCPDSTLN